MGHKNDTPETESADRLIEEALKAVEAREARARLAESDELVAKGPAVSKNSEPSGQKIAQLDPKQFVDRESYLRLAAEFENFRKRATKERDDAEKSGRERVLRGFLEILDNVDRALLQVQDDQNPIVQGLKMILSQSEMWLKSEGCERIQSKGQIFDPNIHEAVSMIESTEVNAGFVIEEIKRGYRLWGRLLRPAHVLVSKGAEQTLEFPPDDKSGDEPV